MITRILQSTSVTGRHRVHGLVFDAGVLLGNCFLPGTLAGFGEQQVPDRTIGFLLIVAVATQLAGAMLKARPLRARLSQRAAAQGSGCADWLMGILLFPLHFILFSVVAMMALSLLGIFDPDAASSRLLGNGWVPTSLLIAGLTTAMVWRAGKRPDDEETEGQFPIVREYVADVLLWVSVSITTRYFSLYELIGPTSGLGLSLRSAVLLVALSLLFVAFYLPSRTLFLVEDHRHVGTWARMWLAMVPLAWRILVG